MAIVCWIVFFALLILAFVRKTNMGFLAFGAALILGHIIGMTDKEIVKTLSQSLFVTLTGITLLFSAVNSTGALEMVSKKIAHIFGKKVWTLPIIAYLIGFILAVIGPGAIPPTTLVVTMTVSIAISAGYNPIMMGVIGGLGLMGGRVAAITPEGNLVANLAAEQGITSNVILPVCVFQIVTTVIAAVILFFVMKGHKNRESEVKIEAVKATKQQLIALGAIVVMLVLVVIVGLDTGLTSFLLAALLFLFHVVDERTEIKNVPWGTIVMILGVGVLMSIISKAGGIDMLCSALSGVMSAGTVAPLSGITAGIMSLVSSGLGVVYPTLIPMASELVETVGGGNAVSVISAIVAGGSLAGFSPMSTCGALTLGAMSAMMPNMSKEEQNKNFIKLIIIAVCFILWVGISSAIFGNLCASIGA